MIWCLLLVYWYFGLWVSPKDRVLVRVRVLVRDINRDRIYNFFSFKILWFRIFCLESIFNCFIFLFLYFGLGVLG